MKINFKKLLKESVENSDLDEKHLELAKDPIRNDEELQRMVDDVAREIHQYQWDMFAKRWEGSVEAFPRITSSVIGGTIKPNQIIVKKSKRGGGIGSKFMQDMINLADSQGRFIEISPSTDFGASSVNRLKDFYKRFGFVCNSGRNKDYSISSTMYRTPTEIKSFDPVTYDGMGNVIPLSKRFKESL